MNLRCPKPKFPEYLGILLGIVETILIHFKFDLYFEV